MSTGSGAVEPTLPLAAGATAAAILNLHAGWQHDWSIICGSLKSDTVKGLVQTGGSTAAYGGTPKIITGASYINGILSKTTFSDGTAQ